MKSKILFIVILFALTCKSQGQLSQEGKSFLIDLFYGLGPEITPIQTANTLEKNKQEFYEVSFAGLLGSNSLVAYAKSNKYFTLNECQKNIKSSVQLMQWYDQTTNKSNAKRIAVWCTDFSLFYSIRNLVKSISWDYREGSGTPEWDGQKELYKAYFWDDEKTAKNGGDPFFIISIYKDAASTSKCYGCQSNYVIWLTFQENSYTK